MSCILEVLRSTLSSTLLQRKKLKKKIEVRMEEWAWEDGRVGNDKHGDLSMNAWWGYTGL